MYTEDLLSKLTDMVTDLRQVTSPYDKVSIVKRYGTDVPEILDLLKLIYNPRYVLNVTGNGVMNSMGQTLYKCLPDTRTVFEILDGLHTRMVTGMDAIMQCINLILLYPMYEDTITGILNKDLSCGINTKTVNHAFPGAIPEFSVPLASEYLPKLVDYNKYQWFLSRKIDGVRCLCFIYASGDVRFYSRNGIEFTTLNKVKEEIQSCINRIPVNIILDGEVCIMNGDSESFKDITSEFRRKDHTIQKPEFHVFDMYSIKDFESGSGQDSYPYSVTLEALKILFKDHLKGLRHVKLLHQYELHSETDLMSWIESKPKDWEGFILRRGDHTQFKRSKRLLKVKQFKDRDFVVKNTVLGTKSINGVEMICVSSIVIEFNGKDVGVGSGLSDAQRLRWLDPTEIIGKIVTIKYFEVSSNKRGEESLRFPILKDVRDYE